MRQKQCHWGLGQAGTSASIQRLDGAHVRQLICPPPLLKRHMRRVGDPESAITQS